MLPTDKQERKDAPIYSGFLAYFPRAAASVAKLSKVGNDQHNPGEALHWSREKSKDHADCIARHQLEWWKDDEDGVPHAAKVAWRALAQLELLLLHREQGWPIEPSNIWEFGTGASGERDEQPGSWAAMNPDEIDQWPVP